MKAAILKGIALASLAASVLFAPHADAAIVIAGPIVNPANGHRYFLLSMDRWQDSQAAAVQLGGSLVTVNDEQEQVWVYDTFANDGGKERNLWIGLNDLAHKNTFVWADSDAAKYRNWAALAPDPKYGDGISVIQHPLRTL